MVQRFEISGGVDSLGTLMGPGGAIGTLGLAAAPSQGPASPAPASPSPSLPGMGV